MTDFPTDVIIAAAYATDKMYDSENENWYTKRDIIARAIMAERERCAKVIAYNLTKSSVTTNDAVRSVSYRGFTIITHPDIPQHIWNGKTMTRLDFGVDFAKT